MGNRRAQLRQALSGLSGLFLLFVIGPLISEFVIKWAEEEGAYNEPSKRVASVMDWLAAITGNWWFAIAFGFVAGGTIFMWVDYFIRQRVRPGTQEHTKYPIDPTNEQLRDLSKQIDAVKSLVDEMSLLKGDDHATADVFHEVMALFVVLVKFGVSTPLIYIKDGKHQTKQEQIVAETFNADVYKYLAAIAPAARIGDLVHIRSMADIAVKNFGSKND